MEYERQPLKNMALLRVESMSDFTDIELSEEQVADYCWARASQEPLFLGMSDQNILYHCLSPEQQEKFSKVFVNINFI